MAATRPKYPSVVIIPARGGSQRVPGKNIRLVHGTPALSRVIALSLDSGVADRVVVTTDSLEIARVARDAGAEVPFHRPDDLADSHTGIVPVIQHAVRELSLPAETVVACVYATAFTLDPSDLARGMETLGRSPVSSFVVSITPFDYPIQRALQMDAHGRLTMLESDHLGTRSQDLPERWHDAGQFIIGSVGTWLQAASVWNQAVGLSVTPWRVVDIDTEEDWQLAELIVRAIELRTAGR